MFVAVGSEAGCAGAEVVAANRVRKVAITGLRLVCEALRVREKYTSWTPELYEYLVQQGTRQDPALAAVERETAELGGVSVMQVAPEQGALLELLVRATGTRRALEVGTFTGYSAICIARGLPEAGSLLCCELDEGYAKTARANLERAGVADRVEIQVGPAIDTLRGLPQEEQFDFAFVDADKTGYPDYLEEILPRAHRGGLILLDNVLMSSAVLDPGDRDGAAAMDALNRELEGDERVDLAMVGIADGISILRKR